MEIVVMYKNTAPKGAVKLLSFVQFTARL